MRPIASLSLLALGLLASWLIFLLWASIYILIMGLGDKRRMDPALRNTLLCLLCLTDYALFQCTIGYTTQNNIFLPHGAGDRRSQERHRHRRNPITQKAERSNRNALLF